MAILQINPDGIKELAKTEDKVIVDFWAPWCGPCRAFGPVFEKMSEKYADYKFIKVNIDENQGFAAANQISSIPTVWVYSKGELVYNRPGALLPDQFEQLISA